VTTRVLLVPFILGFCFSGLTFWQLPRAHDLISVLAQPSEKYLSTIEYLRKDNPTMSGDRVAHTIESLEVLDREGLGIVLRMMQEVIIISGIGFAMIALLIGYAIVRFRKLNPE